MPTAKKLTFSLPAEDARYIDDQVAAGAYASRSEVVRAGLRSLQEHDAVEEWLRDEVLPTYDAMIADPSRGIPAEEVRRTLHARFGDPAKTSE